MKLCHLQENGWNLISQAQKSKYHIFSSFVETKPKIMIMIIVIGQECKRGLWGSLGRERKKERKGH
jgi:hypothetical protein